MKVKLNVNGQQFFMFSTQKPNSEFGRESGHVRENRPNRANLPQDPGLPKTLVGWTRPPTTSAKANNSSCALRMATDRALRPSGTGIARP